MESVHIPRKQHIKVKEKMRSVENLLWDSSRNKREAEKYKWEIEKHKLFVEKQKLELEEASLKTKMLQMKLKNLITGDVSRSPFSATSEDYDQIEPKSQDNSNTQNVDEAQNFINIDALCTQIKIEPSLDITDIGDDYANDANEDRSLNNRNEKRKSTDVDGIVLGGMCKKLRNIQSLSSDEQQQWELALKNDMVDTPNIKDDSGFIDTMQLEHADISSYDDNESDTCNVSSEEFAPLEPTTDDSLKVTTDEHVFLNLLNKHKLQHYFLKLKEMNIGSDYLQYIQEIDIRDICVGDIGARIRFRALLEDWRILQRMPKTAFKSQTDFVVAKGVHESIAIQCKQKSKHKKILPETPYRSILDFKMFVELIESSEAAYQNLITELIAQNTNNSVNFLKTSWRRIMSDHVAQHFCWTGTLEKPAIRTLRVTKALKEAYQRKFAYSSTDDFQRTIQQFFQHAKTRLQKKQNYEKLKAANTTF